MKKNLLVFGLVLLGSICSIQATEDSFEAHEWGTFTTLHWPLHGSSLPWYQAPQLSLPNNKVSDLPDFINGLTILVKGRTNAFARMETPVIYFYTDKPIKASVEVKYPDGSLTEYYPGFLSNWKEIEIIPPEHEAAQNLKLPVDPRKPNNHYYEARAVPDAAYVTTQLPSKNPEKPSEITIETERFLFYRGMGNFYTQLTPSLSKDLELSLINYNTEHKFEHVWVVKSDGKTVNWKKLPPFPKMNYDNRHSGFTIDLKELPAPDNSNQQLEKSMVTALHSCGLTLDEAKAMVKTWEKQWYLEPGQRVFSIVAPEIIDKQLPLKITPKPTKIERVFVHRQEILDPNVLDQIENAMKPGTELSLTRMSLSNAKLGRFSQGVVNAIANDIGKRTTAMYLHQGISALKQEDGVSSVTPSLLSLPVPIANQ